MCRSPPACLRGQVAAAAHAAVLGLAPLLTPGDAGPALLAPLDSLLAPPGADAEARGALAGLLCALGPGLRGALGPARAERELLPRVAALAADPAYAVRRVRAPPLPGNDSFVWSSFVLSIP